MHFKAILFGLSALSSTAMSMALPPATRSTDTTTEIGSYQITGFEAGAVVLSHRVYYRFNVTYSPSLPPAACFALGTTLDEELSTIQETRCTETPEGEVVSFKWTRKPDGSGVLSVYRSTTISVGVEGDPDGVRSVSVSEEATHVVPVDQTQVVGQGEFAHAVYEGPADFSVPVHRVEGSS